MKTDLRYWAEKIIDRFEDLLKKYNMRLPCEEKEKIEGRTAIYGSNYQELEEAITEILEQQQKTKNVRNNINNNSFFGLCKDYTFEKIKQISNNPKELYNKINLAFLENERHNISAVLYIYNGKLYVGYNVHGDKDYNILQGNVEKEEIDINSINTVKELENMMKEKLAYFFIINREYIEKVSKNLGELEIIECEIQDDEEL